MKRVCCLALSLVFCAVAFVFAGCASGGADPTVSPTPTPPPSKIYEPNYFSSLGAGRQWRTFSLRYRVNSDSGGGLATHFSTARAAWEPHFTGIFTLLAATGSTAEIEIETVPAGALGGDTIGSTTITFQRSDSKIIKALIQIDASLGDDLMPQVLAHELGHTLGLDGHSPDAADLMFLRAHLPLSVTERDRNTFFTVYADQLALRERAVVPPASSGSALVSRVICRYRHTQ